MTSRRENAISFIIKDKSKHKFDLYINENAIEGMKVCDGVSVHIS